MPKLATEVDKLIDEVAQLHFELMELRHKQSKVALAERRLRYLDYQKWYYREKIATDSHRRLRRRRRLWRLWWSGVRRSAVSAE